MAGIYTEIDVYSPSKADCRNDSSFVTLGCTCKEKNIGRKPYLYLVAEKADRYQVREPRPCDSTQADQPSLDLENLLAETTSLCDQMERLHALNHFFFASVEALFEEGEIREVFPEASRRGLNLHVDWLRQYSKEVKSAVKALHATIRDGKHKEG